MGARRGAVCEGLEKMTLWIVGKIHPDKYGFWAFQGVYDDEKRAIDACRDELYFIGPAQLNEQLPLGTQPWPGAYYPMEQK